MTTTKKFSRATILDHWAQSIIEDCNFEVYVNCQHGNFEHDYDWNGKTIRVNVLTDTDTAEEPTFYAGCLEPVYGTITTITHIQIIEVWGNDTTLYTNVVYALQNLIDNQF